MDHGRRAQKGTQVSLADLVNPPAAPARKGKVVRQLKRTLATTVQARKVAPLAAGDEVEKAETARAKRERMKPLVFAVREAIAQQQREAAQEKLRVLREGWR
jgi:hypothetical protein